MYTGSWRSAVMVTFLLGAVQACSGTLEYPARDSAGSDLMGDLAPVEDLGPRQDLGPHKDLAPGKDQAPGKDLLPPDACSPSVFSHPLTSDPSSASPSVKVLKTGKGFSASGWNSNNGGMILYSAGKPITKGHVEVQIAGFTNASLAAQSLKFHIVSGWQINKAIAQSKWQMRLSPSNIMKITACEVASGSAWGNCEDATLNKVVSITSKTAFHTYKFTWGKQRFQFHMDGKLISQAQFNKDIIIQHIYLGNDISSAVSMHKEDITIRDVKIVSNTGCP